MSLTSWLFGKKKSPEEQPSNNISSSNCDDSDQYIFVERKNVYPVLPSTAGASELPYPVATPTTSQISKQNSFDQSTQHPLADVPFRLNGQLIFSEERIEQDQKECQEVKQIIKNLHSVGFNYNFEREHGILTELDSMNTE